MEAFPDISIEIETGIDVVAYKDNRSGLTTVEELKTDADLIIVQRPLHQWFCSMIEQAHRQDIAVVVEMDDDFENVHRRNVVWPNVQPSVHAMSNYEWLKQACDLADHVTVSTDALTRYAPHGRVSVVPNYIARRDITDHMVGPPHDRPVRIGWSGTVQTHPTDLQVTRPAINQVLRDTKSEMMVVGDGYGVRESLGLAKSIPLRLTGWVETDRYMSVLCNAMDVGIVPLDETPFNSAKSNLKGLEMAACGIPFVASPTPEYTALAANGVGEIASNPSEWRRLVSRFVSNEALRVAAGEAYRSVVREKYVLEDNAYRWVEAWRTAKKFRNRCTNG